MGSRTGGMNHERSLGLLQRPHVQLPLPRARTGTERLLGKQSGASMSPPGDQRRKTNSVGAPCQKNLLHRLHNCRWCDCVFTNTQIRSHWFQQDAAWVQDMSEADRRVS